jgi:hypothetical protein
LANGGPAWSGGVGRSRAVAHRHTEDRPVAKVTYFQVDCANHFPCAIVHSDVMEIPGRRGAFLQKRGCVRGLPALGRLLG